MMENLIEKNLKMKNLTSKYSKFKEENLTGTIINYFYHCKRQCWLFANKINLEDNSELVKIGKAIHEAKETQEITIDNIKIDKISDEYLTEIKKSDADLTACKYQILFYLQKLKRKGIVRKGRLEIVEKKNSSRKIQIYELNEETEKELENAKQMAFELLNQETVPVLEMSKKCTKCAYCSYCNI